MEDIFLSQSAYMKFKTKKFEVRNQYVYINKYRVLYIILLIYPSSSTSTTFPLSTFH